MLTDFEVKTLRVDNITKKEFLFEQGLNETKHEHSPVFSSEHEFVRGACCLSCGFSVYTNTVRGIGYDYLDDDVLKKSSTIVHCSNVSCENNSGDMCRPTGVKRGYINRQIEEDSIWPDWVVASNDRYFISDKHKISDSIVSLAKEHHGDLVLCSGEVYRLLGVASDRDDYYWMLRDKWKINYHSCVGGFTVLKGYITDDKYERMDEIERMNSNYEIPSEPFQIYIG